MERDWYREQCKAANIGMHADLVRRFVQLQALLITPLAPHWAESVWLDLLGEKSSIQNALYPAAPAPDATLQAVREYIELTTGTMLRSEGRQLKRKQKGTKMAFDPNKSKKLTIFIASTLPEWQEKYLSLAQQLLESTGKLEIKAASAKVDKADMKKAIPFIQGLKTRLDAGEKPERVFERQLPFEETKVLREMVPGLKSVVKKLRAVEVVHVDEKGVGEVVISSEEESGATRKVGESISDAGVQGDLVPGKPSFTFENVEE